MVEVELKFQIPAARRTALLKALDPKKSQQILLQAKYYDTADRQLAQHGNCPTPTIRRQSLGSDVKSGKQKPH